MPALGAPGLKGTLRRQLRLYATSAQELDRKLETFRWALRLRSGSVLRVKRQRWLEGRARRATVYFKLPAASLRGAPALGN